MGLFLSLTRANSANRSDFDKNTLVLSAFCVTIAAKYLSRIHRKSRYYLGLRTTV